MKVFLFCWLLFSVQVIADVWFYQDPQGVMHFAQKKQGKEWTLLMRTPEHYASEKPKPKPAKPAPTNAFDGLIEQAALRYQLDPALLHAVIYVESNYQHHAISKAGAMGLMQLMPATAQRFKVDNPFEPSQNIEGGSRYLRWLIDEFDSLQLALAAYNSGENTVKRYGYSIPPYPETQKYVEKVIKRYKANLTL